MKIHARFKCNEFTLYNALFLFKICFVSLTVRFRAVIKNNFPVDISAQLFFVDDYGELICDAFREPLEIKSAGLPQEQYYEAELSNEFEGEMLDSIRQSK